MQYELVDAYKILTWSYRVPSSPMRLMPASRCAFQASASTFCAVDSRSDSLMRFFQKLHSSTGIHAPQCRIRCAQGIAQQPEALLMPEASTMQQALLSCTSSHHNTVLLNKNYFAVLATICSSVHYTDVLGKDVMMCTIQVTASIDTSGRAQVDLNHCLLAGLTSRSTAELWSLVSVSMEAEHLVRACACAGAGGAGSNQQGSPCVVHLSTTSCPDEHDVRGAHAMVEESRCHKTA